MDDRVDVLDPSLYPLTPRAMVDWALSVGLIDLQFSSWAQVTLKQDEPNVLY
jgi:hypothetical protein